jgi:hypothetical protein
LGGCVVGVFRGGIVCVWREGRDHQRHYTTSSPTRARLSGVRIISYSRNSCVGNLFGGAHMYKFGVDDVYDEFFVEII